MQPTYTPGRNIAMKVPPHEYDKTLSFYRDILGLREVSASAPSPSDSKVFQFGEMRLWIDKIAGISQAEIWLEVVTDDIAAAARHLEAEGVIRRDEIEPLPDGFQGFWICNPANLIHLINA